MTTKIVEDNSQKTASTKLINAKMVTVIANSRAEHCIYTYRTDVDSHFDIKAQGFFNPLYTFLQVGDVVRVFRFEGKTLMAYYEYIAVEVDTLAKKVVMASLIEKNLQNNIVGKAN